MISALPTTTKSFVCQWVYEYTSITIMKRNELEFLWNDVIIIKPS